MDISLLRRATTRTMGMGPVARGIPRLEPLAGHPAEGSHDRWFGRVDEDDPVGVPLGDSGGGHLRDRGDRGRDRGG
ncbi:hypothetical protein [Nocardia sp. CDC160]|uniref:hypothetical protein n=1 Tax=Nocardia sp. CDC160 TaxID=3112166 RepID=UPI002DBF9F05|nr:hypothetical protein [Nocardia sp. CDC160]MEC3920285.1 hypothetical protein [Nocardia sp. CDC160]